MRYFGLGISFWGIRVDILRLDNRLWEIEVGILN